MTEENALSTLADLGENPPIETADNEIETTETDGIHLDEIDVKPNTAEINAEIEALKKLKEQKEKAERETGYWRRKEAESRMNYERNMTTPIAPPAKAEATGEPDPDSFDDYTDFVKALADHRVKVARQQWDQEAANRGSREAQKEREANLKVKMDEGFIKYNDFADVTFDPTATHITPLIVDILADCEHPADVAYHLAKNRVDGVKISRMTPTMAAREIAKLDLRFGDGKSIPDPPKKTTSAPPPIKPVGSSNTVAKDPEKMTQAEFEAHRKAQGAKPY